MGGGGRVCGNYKDEGVKLNKTISTPDKTTDKGNEGEGKRHILHTSSGKHQFLHHTQ